MRPIPLALLFTACLALSASSQEPEKTPAAAPSADEQAVRAVVEEFARAFNAGDVAALTALFTPDAEILLDSGEPIVGIEAVKSRFEEALANNPERSTLSLQTTSIRFLSPEVAVEEGISTLTRPGEPPSTEKGRYTVVYVKREGKWLQSIVRDAALDEPTPYDRLKELEWMIGEWIDESDQGVIQTTCQWSDNKAFLVRDFKVLVQGETVLSGSQRVGWDPLSRQIKSWVFDSEGGHSEGYWAREGDTWVIKSSGVMLDGQIVTATNVITRLDSNTHTWSSVDRTIGGAIAPDLEPIKVVRKAPAPAR